MEPQHLVTLQATSYVVLMPGRTRAHYVEQMAKSFRGNATRLYFAILETSRRRHQDTAKLQFTQL
jgi:hypothetical protein